MVISVSSLNLFAVGCILMDRRPHALVRSIGWSCTCPEVYSYHEGGIGLSAPQKAGAYQCSGSLCNTQFRLSVGKGHDLNGPTILVIPL